MLLFDVFDLDQNQIAHFIIGCCFLFPAACSPELNDSHTHTLITQHDQLTTDNKYIVHDMVNQQLTIIEKQKKSIRNWLFHEPRRDVLIQGNPPSADQPQKQYYTQNI